MEETITYDYVTEEVTEIEDTTEEYSSAPADQQEPETELTSFEYITEEVTEIEELPEEYSSAPDQEEPESEYAASVYSDSSSDDLVTLLQEQNELIQAQTDAINYNSNMIVFVILCIWLIKSVKSSVFKMTHLSRKEMQ